MAEERLVGADSYLDRHDEQLVKWDGLPTSLGYEHDFVLAWLYGTPESKTTFYARVFLILGVVPFVLLGVTATIEDTLILQGEDAMGFFQDRVILALILVLPLTVVLLKRLLTIAGKTFVGLQSSINKKKVTKDEYSDVLDKIWQIVDGTNHYRKFRYLLMAGGFAFWVYSSFAHYTYLGYKQGSNIWSFGDDHPLSFGARTVWELLIFVFLYPILIYKVVALIYAMNSFFREIPSEGFRVRVVAPDGAAGLGQMGGLALNLEFMFVPFIVVAVIYAVADQGTTPIFFITFPLLMGLLVVAFFFPLSSAHKTMRDAKDRAMETLEKEFNLHYDFLIYNVQELGASLSDLEAAKSIENIKEVKYLYEETEKMPVWPFDFTTLRRFSATILLPTLVVILGEYWGPEFLQF